MSGFKSPEEFDAWKLSWELKERIVAFTTINPAVRDRKFCEEILESARSAPDNISEGFYRFNAPRVSGILCVGHNMRRLYAPHTEIGETAGRGVGADPG